MSIEIWNVDKRFGAFQALKDVSLSMPSGELVALLGPSGCGKTTLLRIIAGLERPDAGQILFHGEDITDRHVREREVGFVFQHYALFHVGNVRAPVPQHVGEQAARVAGHLRPHEIELSREPADSIGSGVVSHVCAVGPVVRLELIAEENPTPVQVELPKERYREEAFRLGERLFLRPRTFRVFADA